MNVKLIGKHEKDSRACRDGLALTLDEMMAQDKSICYVDCDLMGCINTKRLREHYPDRAFEAGIAEGNAAGVSAGLAATGKKVFFHSFGTFSSRRCYDQIYMSAAYAGDAKTASSSRDVWLKRAQSNADAFMTGMASWYGADFHNKKTASGEGYDMYTFTAAHRTLPIGTVVRVTDKSNGKSVMVCVTDRGPYVRGRIIDLSYAAAQQINMNNRGVGKVDLEVVSDPSGTPLQNGQAYFVRYKDDQVGPFFAFADAAAMHEALRQGHPEAEVVLDDAGN